VQQGIAATVRDRVKDEAVQRFFATLGTEALGSLTPELGTQVRDEAARMDALIKRYLLD
jgi:hypothetical protein